MWVWRGYLSSFEWSWGSRCADPGEGDKGCKVGAAMWLTKSAPFPTRRISTHRLPSRPKPPRIRMWFGRNFISFAVESWGKSSVWKRALGSQPCGLNLFPSCVSCPLERPPPTIVVRVRWVNGRTMAATSSCKRDELDLRQSSWPGEGGSERGEGPRGTERWERRDEPGATEHFTAASRACKEAIIHSTNLYWVSALHRCSGRLICPRSIQISGDRAETQT